MIDHIILTVSDFERSVSFYAKALKPLGITNFTDYDGHDGHPDLKGFGDGKRAFFWLKEGKPDPQAVHVGVPGVISRKFSVREIATKSLLVARNDYICKNKTFCYTLLHTPREM